MISNQDCDNLEDIGELFGIPANEITVSFSKISEFDRNGPTALIKRREVMNNGIKTGSLVDGMLFDPDNIKEQFIVSDIEEPTASLAVLTGIILENFTKIPTLEVVDEVVINSNLWASTKKLETRRKNYDTDRFWEYLKLMFSASDKCIVTSDKFIEAEELVSILKTHSHSKSYFNSESLLSQVEFNIPYNNVRLRGIIDMIIIDHDAKTVKVVDLKTGQGDALSFQQSYFKWRYYLQEAVYSIAIKDLIKNTYPELSEYRILDFEFLYIGVKEKIPVIYKVDEDLHNAALYGFTYNNKYYNGLNSLIDDIVFHFTNDVFDVPREVYDNSGVLTFKSEGLHVDKTNKI